MEETHNKSYTIVTAIIFNNDKYLIAKRSPLKKFAANQWEFVSGFMDMPGESQSDAILREIKEELNVEGKILKKLNQFMISDDEGTWTIVPFLISIDMFGLRVNPEDHTEFKWISFDELYKYDDLKPFLNDEIKRIIEFTRDMYQ